MKRLSLMTASLAVMALLSLHTAFAQTPMPPEGPDGGKPSLSLRVKEHAGGMRKQLDELGLSAEQKAKVQAVFQEQRQAFRDMKDRLREATNAVSKAIAENPADEAAVRAASKIAAAASEEMAVLRAKSEAKFQALLTPEQKAKRVEQLNSYRDKVRQMGKELGAEFDREPGDKDKK